MTTAIEGGPTFEYGTEELSDLFWVRPVNVERTGVIDIRGGSYDQLLYVGARLGRILDSQVYGRAAPDFGIRSVLDLGHANNGANTGYVYTTAGARHHLEIMPRDDALVLQVSSDYTDPDSLQDLEDAIDKALDPDSDQTPAENN